MWHNISSTKKQEDQRMKQSVESYKKSKGGNSKEDYIKGYD